MSFRGFSRRIGGVRALVGKKTKLPFHHTKDSVMFSTFFACGSATMPVWMLAFLPFIMLFEFLF